MSVIWAPMPALAIATSRPPSRLDRRCHGVVDLRRGRPRRTRTMARRRTLPRPPPALRLQAQQRYARAAIVQPPGGQRADPASRPGDQDATSLAGCGQPRGSSASLRARRPWRETICCQDRRRARAAPHRRTRRAPPQGVERHRQHLVVPDEHAELDQLDVGELAGAAGPRGRRESVRSAWSSSAARSSNAWRGDQPGASAPSRTRSTSPRSARWPERCARAGPTRSRWRSCARREGSASSVSSRGSTPPGISAPAKRSHCGTAGGGGPSVVKTFGGPPPASAPTSRASAKLTRPMSSRVPGAIRAPPILGGAECIALDRTAIANSDGL